jgi:hypothetical protein
MAIVLECKHDALACRLGAMVAHFNQKTLIWTIPPGMIAVKTERRMLVWPIIGDEVKDPLQKRRVP